MTMNGFVVVFSCGEAVLRSALDLSPDDLGCDAVEGIYPVEECEVIAAWEKGETRVQVRLPDGRQVG